MCKVLIQEHGKYSLSVRNLQSWRRVKDVFSNSLPVRTGSSSDSCIVPMREWWQKGQLTCPDHTPGLESLGQWQDHWLWSKPLNHHSLMDWTRYLTQWAEPDSKGWSGLKGWWEDEHRLPPELLSLMFTVWPGSRKCEVYVKDKDESKLMQLLHASLVSQALGWSSVARAPQGVKNLPGQGLQNHKPWPFTRRLP